MRLEQWSIDPLKSRIGFTAESMGFMKVDGEFLNYKTEIAAPPNAFEHARITFVAYTESLTTDNKKRDRHLKSEDFLHAEKYPEIRFVSENFRQVSENEYILKGKLTIKGISQSVEVQVRQSPSDTQAKEFHLRGIIDRKQFELEFEGKLGDTVVGDEIAIDMLVFLIAG